MYHYVREFRESHPNFRFLDVDNFRKQLDYFEKNFGFVSKSEWDLVLKNRNLGSVKNKVLLTFDDAMSCHYDYVFPELEKRGLWGIFYVPTMPYEKGKLLDVHRIQLLCGAYKGSELLKLLLDLLSEEMIPDKRIEEFRRETYLTQKNYEGITEFKQILNYYVSDEHRESLINKVAEKFGYLFEVEKFYVSEENLKKMSLSGNVIGSHTVTHPVMSKLTRSEQLIQIRSSFNFLNQIGCIKEKTYCHPYGGFYSFNKDTVDLLTAEEVMYSFSVESRDIENKDLLNSLQYLPRFDCNEFPYGKAS